MRFWLLLILVVCVIVFVLKRRNPAQPGTQDDSPNNIAGEETVQCSRCGIYIPKQYSVYRAQRHYCCEAHYQEEKNAK